MYTTADLDAINNAIKTGASSVSYAGRTITNRSLAELIQIRDMICADLNGGRQRSSFRYFAFDKGLR